MLPYNWRKGSLDHALVSIPRHFLNRKACDVKTAVLVGASATAFSYFFEKVSVDILKKGTEISFVLLEIIRKPPDEIQ